MTYQLGGISSSFICLVTTTSTQPLKYSYNKVLLLWEIALLLCIGFSILYVYGDNTHHY